MMYKLKKEKILIILPFIVLLAIASMFFCIPKNANIAYALEKNSVVYKKATCEVLDVVSLTYTIEEFDLANSNAYKRNVVVYFEITSDSAISNYAFGVKAEGTEELLLDMQEVTEGVQEVSYAVTNSGIYDIVCYVYDENGENLDSATITIRCDMEAPNAFATVNAMDSFQKGDTIFNVSFDITGCSDELSGQKEVYYSFNYLTPSTEYITYRKAETNQVTFEITDNGVLTVTYVDNSGNFAKIDYVFDKFDKVSPELPLISAISSSDIVNTNGFTKSYTITITYGDDEQSGTAPQQFYILNGVEFPYRGPFTIDKLDDYIIKASTRDNVDNHSLFAEISLSKTTFDTFEPIISNLKLEVDLTKEKPLSIRFIASDIHSQIDYAYIENTNVYFTLGPNNLYYAEFSFNSTASFVIHVVDKVKNDAVIHVAYNHLVDTKKMQFIENYYNIYHETDFSLYESSVVEDINDTYMELNIALMTENTQNSEFDTILRNIDNLISGDSNHTYLIESKPLYISAMITYEISDTDIADYKKGASVQLVFNALTLDNQKEYVDKTEFSKGFAEAFNLSAYHNEEILTNLTSGIEIEMNMPFGYYERSIVIINKSTEEIVSTTVYNNKIAFTLKESGDYVMVISGEKSIDKEPSKTIKVFGKLMPRATFFGIIFGTAGGAVLVIVALYIVKKRRG